MARWNISAGLSDWEDVKGDKMTVLIDGQNLTIEKVEQVHPEGEEPKEVVHYTVHTGDGKKEEHTTAERVRRTVNDIANLKIKKIGP